MIKQHSVGLEKCDKNKKHIKHWKNKFIKCASTNPTEDINKLWEKLDSKDNTISVNPKCCERLACSNPESVIPKGVKCKVTSKRDSPHFGALKPVIENFYNDSASMGVL